MVAQAENIERKIKKAIKAKTLPKDRVKNLIDQAVEKSVITAEEKEIISKAVATRWKTIQVDDFNPEDYLSRT